MIENSVIIKINSSQLMFDAQAYPFKEFLIDLHLILTPISSILLAANLLVLKYSLKSLTRQKVNIQKLITFTNQLNHQQLQTIKQNNTLQQEIEYENDCKKTEYCKNLAFLIRYYSVVSLCTSYQRPQYATLFLLQLNLFVILSYYFPYNFYFVLISFPLTIAYILLTSHTTCKQYLGVYHKISQIAVKQPDKEPINQLQIGNIILNFLSCVMNLYFLYLIANNHLNARLQQLSITLPIILTISCIGQFLLYLIMAKFLTRSNHFLYYRKFTQLNQNINSQCNEISEFIPAFASIGILFERQQPNRTPKKQQKAINAVNMTEEQTLNCLVNDYQRKMFEEIQNNRPNIFCIKEEKGKDQLKGTHVIGEDGIDIQLSSIGGFDKPSRWQSDAVTRTGQIYSISPTNKNNGATIHQKKAIIDENKAYLRANTPKQMRPNDYQIKKSRKLNFGTLEKYPCNDSERYEQNWQEFQILSEIIAKNQCQVSEHPIIVEKTQKSFPDPSNQLLSNRRPLKYQYSDSQSKFSSRYHRKRLHNKENQLDRQTYQQIQNQIKQQRINDISQSRRYRRV